MDSEYVLLSVLLIALGVTGIVLFNGPKTPAGDSCVCIIPSPEAGAMQGTASILLIFGVMFVPIAILKGGPPMLRKAPTRLAAPLPPVGKVFTPLPIASGKLYGLGALLLFVGIDLIVIPAFLVLENKVLLIGGALIALLGAFLVYQGIRTRNGQKQPTTSA